MGAATVLSWRALHAAGMGAAAAAGLLAVVLTTSYPVWFLLYTANLELVLWALTMAALWAWCRGKPGLAATLFGLAIACKTYPVVYLLLFLRRRQCGSPWSRWAWRQR